ncbi:MULTISPECIES: hypothetical protein [Achromobacter]|uniref:hypothetical protein n=1 Tax=Achromobacter TaxID=222 RepID=UPI0013145436|nr:hypothetical protein [Achromobacter sp. K91]
MEKVEQPDQRDDAEQQIQPLSAEETQAVSGGWGPNRTIINVAPQKDGWPGGKTLYMPR